MLDLVGLVVIDRPDAYVDQHLKTVNAGTGRDINIGILDRNSVFGGLSYGVDLRMNGIDAVLLDRAVGVGASVNFTVYFIAVRQTGGCSVVSGRKNVVVAHDHGTDMAPCAGGPA